MMIREAFAPHKKLDGNKIRCDLCPRHCVIPPGRRGFCKTRENRDGKLYTLIYGSLTALAVDPIEKKPLYNFWPGALAFSISTVGCSFACKFCQNWSISQVTIEEARGRIEEYSPEEIVALAKKYDCETIAYTYNEPIIWFEFVYDTAKLAHKEGVKNILVTNGYITLEALEELVPYIDAANIDIKAFSDKFYKELCSVPSFKPVLEATKYMKEKGVHVECTNLIIPGYNDNFDEIRQLARWVFEELGPDTPLHFSRFYPHYKMIYVSPTPISTLVKAREIAMKEIGLHYVYIGNVPGHEGEYTYCPECGYPVVKRLGFDITEWNLTEDMKCKKCGTKIAIKGEYRGDRHRLINYIR